MDDVIKLRVEGLISTGVSGACLYRRGRNPVISYRSDVSQFQTAKKSQIMGNFGSPLAMLAAAFCLVGASELGPFGKEPSRMKGKCSCPFWT